MRPRLLDLFCGAGGAAMGYHRAGFDVTGVDIRPQPRYPFEFVQADAMTFPLDGWDVIHASPPCQDYSRALRSLVTPGRYPRLIDAMRERARANGQPWIIENVPGSPIPSQPTLDGANGLELCGTMFGLRLYRHRLFESSHSLWPPRGCDHSIWQEVTPYSAEDRRRFYERTGGTRRDVTISYRNALGVDWMTSEAEICEAIPPAYTEYIGGLLLAELSRSVV